MRHYIYTDTGLLEQYLGQAGSAIKGRRKSSKTVSLSIAGPRVDLSEEHSPTDMSTHERIESLVSFLKDNNQLAFRRPTVCESHQPPEKHFILEQMEVSKVILPCKVLEQSIGKNRELVVWISEPDPHDLTENDPSYKGTFVYLTEARLDTGTFNTTWSGCSALQAVANASTGQAHLITLNPDEPLGRGSTLHPVKKLVSIGAFATGEVRSITALYKMRYFTNEQCWRSKGIDYRVNDLLGYPIFIAEAV